MKVSGRLTNVHWTRFGRKLFGLPIKPRADRDRLIYVTILWAEIILFVSLVAIGVAEALSWIPRSE